MSSDDAENWSLQSRVYFCWRDLHFVKCSVWTCKLSNTVSADFLHLGVNIQSKTSRKDEQVSILKFTMYFKLLLLYGFVFLSCYCQRIRILRFEMGFKFTDIGFRIRKAKKGKRGFSCVPVLIGFQRGDLVLCLGLGRILNLKISLRFICYICFF